MNPAAPAQLKSLLVALSGGVDSAMTAFLLRRQGHDVAGAYMHVWHGTPAAEQKSMQAEHDARAVAARLDIPFHVFHFEREFKAAVIDYFSAEYAAGRTPNPCCVCNAHIKFTLFLERARHWGLDGIATGHYVGSQFDKERNVFVLTEGADARKDQSYFLFLLTQAFLARSVFPLATYIKEQVKQYARDEGIVAAEKTESQEICFIPENDYASFLVHDCGLVPQPGAIRDTTGAIRGTHQGYFHYTVGQRRGLGIGSAHPLYVVAVDSARNEVIVGTKTETLRRECVVSRVHWIDEEKRAGIYDVQVRVRYNQPKIPARITVAADQAAVMFIDQPEVITPGQAAVFYHDKIVLGGGWIV